MTAGPADRRVRIYEVGPRDGLQNEATPIALDDKLRFIALLADAGLREIEATSLVAPRAIPQLADADPELFAIALVTPDGTVRSSADADVEISIQSAVKPFLFALALLFGVRVFRRPRRTIAT